MAAETSGTKDGVATALLHQDDRETVTFTAAAANSLLEENSPGGIEVLVLGGSLTVDDDELVKGSWLRLPDGIPLSARAGADGAKVWMKSGHLPFAKAPSV